MALCCYGAGLSTSARRPHYLYLPHKQRHPGALLLTENSRRTPDIFNTCHPYLQQIRSAVSRTPFLTFLVCLSCFESSLKLISPLILFQDTKLEYILLVLELFHKELYKSSLWLVCEIASTESPAAVSAQSLPGLSYWIYWSGLRPLRTGQSEQLRADHLGNPMR